MFGISFPKILVLVAVIAAVWFGFRWFQRWEKERAARQAAGNGGAGDRPQPQVTAEDMTACRVCGTYVAARSARACGRAGCPYPR